MVILVLILIVIAVFIAGNGKGMPVFLFHQINPDSKDTPEMVEEFIKYLSEKKVRFLDCNDLNELINANKKIPPNSCMLTIDDGYYDNYKYLFPILLKYGAKATIFLNTGYIGKTWERERGFVIKNYAETNLQTAINFVNGENTNTPQILSWAEIKEMNNSGYVDFGMHTVYHRTVFSERIIKGFVAEKDKNNREYILSYGRELVNGLPVFKMRGEMAAKRIIADDISIDTFMEFSKNKFSGTMQEAERIVLANEFMAEHPEIFKKETDTEFEERLKKEITINKSAIEEELQKSINSFAWPWGHRSKEPLEILKKENVKLFFTCRTGTNSGLIKNDKIRRVELRKTSLRRYKINYVLLRNSVSGKIIELFGNLYNRYN